MKRTVSWLVAVAGLGAALVGCGDPDWVGTYSTTGHWNLSGPLADGRGVSDALVDLMINEVADKTPLPFGTNDDLAVALDALIRAPLRSEIERGLPPDLKADGRVTTSLRSALLDVTVNSTLVLEDGLDGEETFDKFQLTIADRVIEVRGDELNPDGVKAEWEADVEDAYFEVETHEVPLGFGALVIKCFLTLVDALQLTGVAESLVAALECPTLADAILAGRTELPVEVGPISVDISRGTLIDACELIRGVAGREVFGVFPANALVQVGGKVEYSGGEGEKVTLKQGDGFGGILLVLPEPIAPKINVAFQGVQQ